MPSSASLPAPLSSLSLPAALPISSAGAVRQARHLSTGLVPADTTLLVTAPGAPSKPPHLQLALADGPGYSAGLLNAASTRQPGLVRSEEHTSELQSRGHLVCRLLLHCPLRSPLFPYPPLFRSPVPGLSDRLDTSARDWFPPTPRSWSPRRARRPSRRTCNSPWPTARATPPACSTRPPPGSRAWSDRKSTRLNSSHVAISYAVFCFTARSALLSFPTRRSSDLQCRGCPTGSTPQHGIGSRRHHAPGHRAGRAVQAAAPATRPGRRPGLLRRPAQRGLHPAAGPGQIGRAHV